MAAPKKKFIPASRTQRYKVRLAPSYQRQHTSKARIKINTKISQLHKIISYSPFSSYSRLVLRFRVQILLHKRIFIHLETVKFNT
jgi:hypothetical protein